jgi:hypothetical protein
MRNIIFKIKDIADNQKYRPSGYYDDVVSRGKIINDYIEIPYTEAVALVEKYHEKNPIIQYGKDIDIWGPKLWDEFHGRPDKYLMDIDAEKRWLGIFESWIPCGKCKTHFSGLLKENPVDLSSARNYKIWTIMIHNLVNESLNKPIYNPEI